VESSPGGVEKIHRKKTARSFDTRSVTRLEKRKDFRTQYLGTSKVKGGENLSFWETREVATQTYEFFEFCRTKLKKDGLGGSRKGELKN